MINTRYLSEKVSLSAVTEDTNGTAIDISHVDMVTAYVDVASSPTTVDVTVQIKRGSTWYNVDTRTLEANSSYYVPFPNTVGSQARVITASQTGGAVTATIVLSSKR